MTDAETHAKSVLHDHIAALNARDEQAIAATLHFPHFRLTGTKLKTWESADTYFADFRDRAGGSWARSAFENILILRSSDAKVHFDVRVDRFDAQNELITSFQSLWVITRENGKWAAKFRSSFAAS